MSNTKNHKIRAKFNRQISRARGLNWRQRHKVFHEAWENLTEDQKRAVDIDYAKNPSWFNKLFNSRPSKRKNKVLCKKVKFNPDLYDATNFPVDKKPHHYYW